MFIMSIWTLCRVWAVLVCLLTIAPQALCDCYQDLDANLDGDGSYYTNTWTIEFHREHTDQEVNEIAKQHGCLNHGKVLRFDNVYEFHHLNVPKTSAEHAVSATDLFHEHEHIKEAVQQVAKRRIKRDHKPEEGITMRDPQWGQTWYLNRGIHSGKFDMNVIGAWKKGYTGKNVVVTILDDGIERTHPDLQKNYDAEASKDINDKDDDPMPRYDYTNENRHGTRCAGEVAAVANNTKCSVGVAYDAKIGGVRMLDGSVTDSVEAASLSHASDHVDIYSSSWGPDDNGRTVDGPGPKAKKAFIDGVKHGRGGKGNIFMWASGNGGSHKDSCACDGYTNSIYTLSVSSATERDTPPWYLEECASTLATTYSSGRGMTDRQIVTTDLRKMCTSSHTGTSASAPLAAGLVAVMLEANPDLTWRDVQYVTLAAANPEPLLGSGKFAINAAKRPLKFSHKFGFGLMDCTRMTEIALTWKEVPPQLIKSMQIHHPDHVLSIGQTYRGEIVVPPCKKNDFGCIQYLEHVQLKLTVSAQRRGSLSVKLISPQATMSTVLPTRSSDYSSAKFDNWPFLSVHFWGENPAGTWKFEITSGQQTGKVSSYQLILHGVSVDPFDPNRPQTTEEITCDDNCAKSGCYGSAPDQCKLCKDGLRKIVDTHLCTQLCGDGYYADTRENERTCELCDSTCDTCSAGGIGSCVSCSSELLLDSDHHCVETCPDGYYPDLPSHMCESCKENCTSCSSLDDCIVCQSGFDVVKGKCMRSCQLREYRHEDTNHCAPCTDTHCAECPRAEACDVCDPDFKLYQDSCRDDCPSDTFTSRIGRDGGQYECIDCHDSCATCNDEEDNNCLTCPEGYKITADHKCVMNTTCPDGQFRSLGVGECEHCHDSCFSCHEGGAVDCTSCKDERYLRNGECVEDCGDGAYKHTDPEDKHKSCQHCHWLCNTCAGPGPDQCIECSNDATREGERCSPICNDNEYLKPWGQLDHQTDSSYNISEAPCANCSTECATCSGPRESDCKSCANAQALSPDGTCVANCGPGYYKDAQYETMESEGTSYACHTCNILCQTCSGPESSHCTSCDVKHVLWDGQCVEESDCHNNQYYNNTLRECMSCDKSCGSCTGPTEVQCTSCADEDHRLYSVEGEAHGNDADSHIVGECVLCCLYGGLDSGHCCDCMDDGTVECNKVTLEVTTSRAEKKAARSATRFITVVAIAVLGAVVLYLVTFLALQYRSHGRCVWQNSSSAILVDGGGFVEYSSLTDKDTDTLFASDGLGRKNGVNPNGSNNQLDYWSD